MMIGRDFITKSRDFHEVKQRFSLNFSYGLNKDDDDDDDDDDVDDDDNKQLFVVWLTDEKC